MFETTVEYGNREVFYGLFIFVLFSSTHSIIHQEWRTVQHKELNENNNLFKKRRYTRGLQPPVPRRTRPILCRHSCGMGLCYYYCFLLDRSFFVERYTARLVVPCPIHKQTHIGYELVAVTTPLHNSLFSSRLPWQK
jgi:hypothetical protein